MKVAIIGAGISGLSCAHELIRNGIVPTVFERKSFLGEVLDLPVVIFDMFSMPISKPLKYLKKNFDINIKPNFPIEEVIIHGPSKNFTVKSNLGFIVKRGKYPDSIESQIIKDMNIPIKFNTYIDIRDIKNDFDYIVIATGTPDIAKDMNIFESTFECQCRIATVLGDFKESTIIAWVNTEFAKSAYAYLVPNSKNDARLVLIANNIYANELDYYWKKFLQIAKIDYNICNVIDTAHNVGHIKPVKYKRFLFCGNAGGFLDDILGFGSMKACISGVLAAKSIVEKHNYNKFAKKLTEDINQTTKFRKVANTMSNDDYDKLLTLMGLPVIKQLIYHNPFFKVTQGIRVAQLFTMLKRR